MPELPEVQNTVDGLRAHVIGKTIKDVWTDYGSLAYRGRANIKDGDYFSYFRSQTQGTTIVDITRRAKHIFISLDSGATISVHMKMTGHFLYGHWEWDAAGHKWQPPEGFWNKDWELSKEEVRHTMPLSDPFNDFIHLMFTFTDESQLALSDMRTFASVSLLEDPKEVQAAMDQYGPEPLVPGTRWHTLTAKLRTRPNKHIKTALLDQSLIAGFGNIYTDETLWAARVHPESQVGALPDDVWKKIITEGKRILSTALKHGGDSEGDYRRIDGTGGTFHNMHQVYKQEGSPCPRCGTPIEKKQIGPRVGRYCPACQVRY